ncbi:hypothetical protein SLEP1_g25445 [Rubroshorea leprosula]|uniref:Uncharacterized protein n=1 Tax=Rubroshorea leprosula TaxID=152421 RepID=A0AAV5JTG5_9ROSI|nr:hypothetical protein SLEP1_g25445 [Rubroshorea leprosula]
MKPGNLKTTIRIQESYSMVNAYMGSTPPPPNPQMMFEGVTLHQEAWNDDKKMSQNLIGRGGSLSQSGWEGRAAAGIGHGSSFDEKNGFNCVDGCMAQYQTCINMVASSPGTVTYEAVRYEWEDEDSCRRRRLDDGTKWQCSGYRQNWQNPHLSPQTYPKIVFKPLN